MKYIYLMLALIIFQYSNGQDQGLFENDWYLRTVQLDDLAPFFNIDDIDPPIAPFLKISEDLTFNGEGACNSFDGVYTFFNPNNLTATIFNATSNDCGVQDHDFFEDSYFDFISGEFWYEISHDGQGAVLTLGNPLGGAAVFKSYPLATKDFYKKVFTLHPNPVQDKLVIISEAGVEQLIIGIFNIQGKLLYTQNHEFESLISINVSSLVKGVYFLNIDYGNDHSQVEKFIKK